MSLVSSIAGYEALLPVTNTDMVVSVRLQGWSVQHVFE
jgi:hypothetical protein